jgi:4a-hydroxytetrahydrobiopterin dehydratase
MKEAPLAHKHCAACEGDIPLLTSAERAALVSQIPSWTVTADGKRLRREWVVKNFVTALDFFARIGTIAESENHHPDLHLTGYRNVAIEIWTHAVGGLTENDFILAARIDELPVTLKSK